jgi:hypothetical protein
VIRKRLRRLLAVALHLAAAWRLALVRCIAASLPLLPFRALRFAVFLSLDCDDGALMLADQLSADHLSLRDAVRVSAREEEHRRDNVADAAFAAIVAAFADEGRVQDGAVPHHRHITHALLLFGQALPVERIRALMTSLLAGVTAHISSPLLPLRKYGMVCGGF